jgi:Tol biopolymer transport system component
MQGYRLHWLLCVIGLAFGDMFADEIVYSGETDSGWQVFRLALPDGKPRQVTHSPGDKRRPTPVPGRDWIVTKDSQGRALVLEEDKETVLDPDIRSLGDLSVSGSGDWWYFTRLAVNNPQRQFVWRRKLEGGKNEEATELVLRPEKGSFRQVSLSPDGQYLAGTHIWKAGEERIVIIPLARPEDFFYVSPEDNEAFSPAWGPDGQDVYFAMKSESGDYDIFRASLADRTAKAVVQISGTSEWFPSVSPNSEWLTCEQVENGKSILLLVNLQTGKKTVLQTPHSAKEPAWVMP